MERERDKSEEMKRKSKRKKRNIRNPWNSITMLMIFVFCYASQFTCTHKQASKHTLIQCMPSGVWCVFVRYYRIEYVAMEPNTLLCFKIECIEYFFLYILQLRLS